MNQQLTFNRLKNEKSLYLRQHQDNPIHWWAYGPEALQKAKDLNRPIFLSIGYSACHWCHVMSHEAFSNLDVADFMNDHFICIKVDREEFPDLDNYYQKAAHLFSSNGGWPLSAFLLPDMRPFFIGTYYSLQARKNGPPAFMDLLQELTRAYQNDFSQVETNATQVTTALAKNIPLTDPVQFEGHFPAPSGIMEAIKEHRDLEWGGYGGAPKFPQFAFYEWALEQMLEGMVNKEHGEFIISSLEKMLMGGINDQARGGIHRYSTDAKWCVPHFEKMLYDQAGFLRVLIKLSLVYPSPLVFDTLINTLDYLDCEMLSDQKFFFAAQDADSEGVEGLYFTFSESEFEDLINKHDSEDELLSKNVENIKRWFNITASGNFDHALNVISLNPAYKEEIYKQENWDIIRKVRRAIMNERKDRMPPATDIKGIASWNFMILSALCDVVQYSQIDVTRRMASDLLNKTTEHIFKTFLSGDQKGVKLRHSTTIENSLPLLEDFVCFAEAQLRLYEISGNAQFKENFKETLDFITNEFLDNDRMLTRAKFATDFEIYPNQEYSMFDSSFKSPVSTYISLMRRATVLFALNSYTDTIAALVDKTTHTILKLNPLGAGEALRALTYPNLAYRLMTVPRAWATDDKFIKFIPYFFPRFIIDYHDDKNEWQICTNISCELKGIGLEEFIAVLTPKASNNE